MATTANLGIKLLEQSQAQKEVTVNEALTLLDSVIGGGVLDKDLTTPPGSPTAGDRYIVAATATGDWAGKENALAFYFNGAWRFITPGEGLLIWVSDENLLYVFDGSAWTGAPAGALASLKLGINTTADTTNRLAVATLAALFTAIYDADGGNGNIQIKINKEDASDSASILFQTDFSGRAEMGMVGDDLFRFKVSSNGADFFTALQIDNATGNVQFQKLVGTGTPTDLTINAGEITVTKTGHTVDTEAAAASDDLDTISGGANGDFLLLSPADDAHTIVFKDGTGNMRLAGDFTADSVLDTISLTKRDNLWLETARSKNG
jgi:hypothetical protein